ncbi:nicotinate-nucleotide-dimethylbenzimidazolephosphoribosyltransferase [Paraphysoderma sedebokerense]|nr:nicotinate-nucleotide-dimethylbenzimidazolephosphoribosyltransferase [Paraphysoderma sedebokerense]
MVPPQPISYIEWHKRSESIINRKTKPPGSLGDLEIWSRKLIVIQESEKPVVQRCRIVLFAADHGIADEDVSQYPKSVTKEMLRNISNGGAAINALCGSNDIDLKCVDVGVDTTEIFSSILHHKCLPHGTRNPIKTASMTVDDYKLAFATGVTMSTTALNDGFHAVGVGELGIGNTTTASILLAAASGKKAEEVTGRGTGVSDERYIKKCEVVDSVVEKYRDCTSQQNWSKLLMSVGGLEIVALVGFIHTSAKNRLPVLIDGFITLSAYLYCLLLYPGDTYDLLLCAFFSHESDENGTNCMLKTIENVAKSNCGLKADEDLDVILKVKPFVKLGLRLGEGSGAALVFPMLRSAAAIASNMATFESAAVSNDKDIPT